MSKRTRSFGRSLQFALGASAVAALAATTATAQEGAAALEQIETVVVTGSLFKRIESQVALPVTVVDADEIAKSGATNALEVLQLVGQNQSLTISNTSLGSGTGFASYASLRSLGSARTLVLVNGRRMVNNPYQALGVDLNTVPTALIERVEVLSDGASSTYGSDAIAGVVNYIMRRELTGLIASATGTQPEASGGGETYQANLGGGFGSLQDDGWNVYGGVAWRQFESLLNSSRDFLRTAYRPERGFNRLNNTTFPSNYSQSATGLSSVNPSAPQCDPPNSIFANGAVGPRACGFDFAVDGLLPEQEQWSGIARGSVALGEHTASVEYLRGDSEIVAALAPPGQSSLSMTSVNPFYPGQGITPGAAGLNPALPITLNWRMTALGQGLTRTESSTDRILAALEGSTLGWDYQLSALTSSSTVEIFFLNGFVDIQAVRDGLVGANGAPFLNPFGPQTEAGQQWLLDRRLIGRAQRAKGDLDLYGAQVSRNVLELPAGPLSLAFAVEYKEETSQFRNNFALIRRGQGTGLDQSQDSTGERHSMSVAAEASVPLLEDLELGLSVRYDDYSDVGDTTNPKISLRYQPTPLLLLRGSYNTGFRAPTLYDLYAPNALTVSRNRFHDPVLCPGGVPNIAAGAISTRDCNFQFNVQGGGNVDLEPEESDAYSAGFMLQPLSRLAFGADYWEYHLTQSIGALSEAAIFGDVAKYGHLIVRCSQLDAVQRGAIAPCLIPGGDPIAFVSTRTSNLGDTKTAGVDITAEWSTERTRFGGLSFDYRGTYVTRYDFQREENGPFFSRDGSYFDGNPVIRYSHYATLRWQGDAWSARLANRYKSGYQDCNAQCNVQPQFFNKVDDYSVWDLSATFEASRGLSITAGVNNVLDEEPPFTNKTSGLAGWDERFTDPLGRTYLLLLKYEL